MSNRAKQEQVHCDVEDVIFKNNRLHPVIVSFQNGELVPESTVNLHCGIYNCKTTNKKIIAAVANEMTYKGTLEEDEESPCRVLLAIRNKRTNKVRLVEVDQVELKPSIVKNLKDYTAGEDLYFNLHKSFGSKRTKRKLEQRKTQRLEMDAMEAQISQALDASTSTINQSTINMSFDTDDELVPCNRTATNVFEVYKLEDLISASELDSFNELAIELNKNPSAAARYSALFQQCLGKVTDTNFIHCTKIMLYAECLLRFLKMGYRDLKKKFVVVCPESKSLNNRILETFTVPSDSGRARPNHLRDKAVSFIIVLILLSNKYTVNLEAISQSMKIGLTKLQQLCKVLGTVPVSGNKNIQILKIPLPPQISINNKRKPPGRR